MDTFTHIVITAPSPALATVYQSQLDTVQIEFPFLRHCTISCVADPSGVRIGSGGGTLNALHYLSELIGRTALLKAKVAIIHSGGDSRRAPLHSVCGKAWASLNAVQNDSLLATPLTVLIEELSKFCYSILHDSSPVGSIVVASSDVLLDICPAGDKWRSECVQIPLNAVSVVGVPEAPSVAKNHGVLVGTRSPTFNGMATHYLQKPSILEMQRAGAVFEFDDCEGGEAVYIDTGLVIFTGQAVNSFLKLLDDPSVNTCTSKGILLKKECSEKGLTNADAPSALRLELYSDILHAMSLKDSPNDLDTYFNALGISSTEVPTGNKNSTYILALKVIWSTFCRTPLHLVGIPNGMFCHLGTSAELLDLLSYCTSDVIIKADEKALESAPRDCNDAIIFKNNKLKKFSGKYSLKEFVKSSILTRNGSKPYKVIGDITDSSILSTVKGLKGVMLNSMCIPSVDGKGETMLRTSHRSLVEHSVLSGKCSVGQHSVVSHLPGFLGRNLEVLDGMMVQCVPILGLESVSGGSRSSLGSNAGGGGGKGYAHAHAQGVPQGEDKNKGTGTGKVLGLGQGRFVMLLFSNEDDIKVSYKDSKATVCGASWNTLFQYLKRSSEGSLELNACSSILPATVAAWKGSERLSLSALLMCGDAKGMYSWRQYLQLIQRADPPSPSSSSSSPSSSSSKLHDKKNSDEKASSDVASLQSNDSSSSDTQQKQRQRERHLCLGNRSLINALTASRCVAGELSLSSPSATAVTTHLDTIFLSLSRAVSMLSGMLSAHAVQSPPTDLSAAAASTSSIIILVLWCHRLCVQNNDIPQPELVSDLQNVPQNNDSNILSGSQVSDDYNNKNIPHFSQLKGCLFKIQNSFPLLQKLLNEKENENKNKFVIDIETVGVEVEDKIENILNVFSDLWNLNTSGPGSALILLHCLRRGVEEGMRFCSKSGKEKIDRNENENRSKNDNEKEFVSTSNKGKIENSDMKEKRINRDEDIAAAVLALLDTVETIPTTRHPRLFFIISWLLTTTNSEYSSELSSAITDDPFVAPQFMSKNVRKDCSVMDLFVSNSASDDGNNSDACEYFNVNLPILPSVFEWLDSRVNDILTVRSCDVLDSDALLSKGGALTSLIAMWLSSSVNDVLLSLTPSDEAIAKASEIAIVDMVDWFDVKLSNLFSASPSVDSRKSSTFPFLGVKMMTSRMVSLHVQCSDDAGTKNIADDPLTPLNATLPPTTTTAVTATAAAPTSPTNPTDPAAATHSDKDSAVCGEVSIPSGTLLPPIPASAPTPSSTSAFTSASASASRRQVVVVASAPVRVDLAGGWSDTPPISYETEGAVLNVAVRVDGKPSVTCAVRIIDYPVLLLTALNLDNTHACDSEDDDGNVRTNTSTNTKTAKGYEPAYAPKGYKSESVVARGNEDFTDLSNPALPCVLLKAVLVVLGVVARLEGKGSSNQSLNEIEKRKVIEKERENEKGRERAAGGSQSQRGSAVTVEVESFERRLDRLCSLSPSALSSSSSNSSSQVMGQGQGLEIVCCSELPAGSGMGGSSVLAATVLSAVSALLGSKLDKERLIHLVSQVEQVMTTGGGWQDQIGAVYGGFKIARSAASLPVHVAVQPIPTTAAFRSAFEQRTFLIFTGQQRLAKNTLINALRGSALLPLDPRALGPLISGDVSTVSALVRGAEDGARLLLSLCPSSHPDRLTQYHTEDMCRSLENESSDAGMTKSSSAKDSTAVAEVEVEVDVDDALDSLSDVLNTYWSLKKEMAVGSEPEPMRALLQHIAPIASGLSLCGAGAGGYAVVILKRGSVRSDLFTILTSFKPSNPPPSCCSSSKNNIETRSSYDSTFNNNGLTISTVTIDTKGISNKEYVENDDTPSSSSSSSSTSMSRIPHANTRRLADYLFL